MRGFVLKLCRAYKLSNILHFFVGLIADQLVPNLRMYMLHAFQIRNIFQNSSKEETKFYEKILVLYITQILLADEICSIELRNQI